MAATLQHIPTHFQKILEIELKTSCTKHYFKTLIIHLVNFEKLKFIIFDQNLKKNYQFKNLALGTFEKCY